MLEILLVEDEPDIGEVLAFVLAHHGYRVARAHGGAAAADLIAAGVRPAAVVLDLVLPDVDALSFLVWSRRDRVLSEVPVIAASANPMRLEQVTPLVYATMLKPLAFAVLIEMLQRACARLPRRASFPSVLPAARRASVAVS